MKRRAAVLLVVVLAFGWGSSAAAGGWAVGSLDALPAAVAGQRTAVGFTILQHGVTPVNLLDNSANVVGIEIVQADGSVDFFPAIAEGRVGHYLATVDFPAAGSYQWRLRMGWFEPQDLGTLQVQEPAGESTGSAWSAVRVAMAAGTVLLAGVAIADVVVGRRRRRLALP